MNHVTNEFKHSAIARNQSDVRTQWSEVKTMAIVSAVVLSAMILAFAKYC